MQSIKPAFSPVNICCACDENYAKPLAVCLYSLLCNADKSRLSDIVILHSDISPESQKPLLKLAEHFPCCSIRLVDMMDFRESVKDCTHSYITAETNYRLAILGELFSEYDRVLYLDCDTIVEGDISELFDTDLCGNAVGGAKAVDIGILRCSKKGFFIDNYLYNIYEKNSVYGKYIDKNYCLQLNQENVPYDIREYIGTDEYKCISVQQHVGENGDQKYQFTGVTDVILRNSHILSEDSTTCANCGKDFTVKSIKVSQNPKTSYKEGEKFDPTGLKIKVTCDGVDGEQEIEYKDNTKTKFKFSTENGEEINLDTFEFALGTEKIIVTYGNKAEGGSNSADIPITVEAKKVANILIKTPPTKISYIEGQNFDPTGLVITAKYANGKSEDIEYSENSGITFTPIESLKLTDTVVTFTYNEKTTTYPITVTRRSSGGGSSGGSSLPSTPTPDPEPQVGTSNGKTGWDAVVDEIEDAKDGDSVKINMNGTTLLKSNALSAVAGKNVDLVLDMGNGLTWTVKGDTITNTADIDLGVRFTNSESTGIPVEVINLLTGENEYTTLELDHIGDFGFTAILTANMGSKNKGNYANLYYYRESKKTTEFISAGQIDENGNAQLAFTHASEYVIMIDDHPHGAVPGGDTSESKPDTSDTSSDTSDTSSDTSDTSSDTNTTGSDSGNDGEAIPDTGVVMGYAALLISGAVAVVSRKKKRKK